MIEVTVDDRALRGALDRLIALGRDASPVMRQIARLGESATRKRFRTQTGPDGQRWAPSGRVRDEGGRTLVKSGALRDSLSSRADGFRAEWGVNRIYAAIHQFGGTIRPKKDKTLRFRLPGMGGKPGAFVSVKQVKIPARPYIGVSDDDREDILDLLEKRIQGAWDAR
jgi:phage virion morphogenesis protein